MQLVLISLTFFQAVAEAFAQASNGVGVARAKIIGEAVTTVIADAAASAFANADLQGPGKVEVIQESLADAIAIPMAQVIGDAFAIVFEGMPNHQIAVCSVAYLNLLCMLCLGLEVVAVPSLKWMHHSCL